MMTNPDLTALLSAFGRAWHAENDPDPLFTDPCQRRLLTENEFRFMEQYLTIGAADAGTDLRGMMHGLILPPLLSRARLCEDAFRAALRDGTEQFLLLASGLDTAALRWCRETPCPIFEADREAALRDKEARLRRAGIPIPEDLHFVSGDVTSPDWAERLLRGGFRPGKKTFIAVLGISFYLPPQKAADILAALSALTKEGSSLLFDAGSEGFLRSKVPREMFLRNMAQAAGAPMQCAFSRETAEKTLAAHGFTVRAYYPPEEIQSRCFFSRRDGITAFEHIHFFHARRSVPFHFMQHFVNICL